MTGAQHLTATIPADRLPEVHHKVELLIKRCVKRGMPVPAWAEGAHSFVPDPRAARGHRSSGAPVALVEMVDVEVLIPDAIALGGWSLLGRVDVLPDGRPIVARTPGTEAVPLPPIADPYACDYCHKRRTRNETFLVANEQGETAQVGRTCLRDFLGHDPSSLLWLTDELTALSGWLNAPGGIVETYLATAELLRLAARVAAHGGYLGRAKAAEINEEIETSGLLKPYVESTASRVLWRIDRPRAMSLRQWRERIREEWAWDLRYPDDTAAADLFALTMTALASLHPASEWEQNVGAVVGLPQVRYRHAALAVSAIVLGLKAGERAAAAIRKPVPSALVGTPGERLTLEATVVFTRFFEGDYGGRTLLKFETADATLVWWGSGLVTRPGSFDAYEVGDRVRVTGTVKAHGTDRYDGRPITELTRCKLQLVEPVAPAAA